MKARDPMDAPFRGFAFVFKKIPSERAESPMDPRGGSPYNKALRAAQRIANAEGKRLWVDHVTRGGHGYWIIWERRYEGQYTKAEEKNLIDVRDIPRAMSVEVSPSKKKERDSGRQPKRDPGVRGFYHLLTKTGVRKGDFVIYEDHRGRHLTDLVTTKQGHHLTLGSTKGQATIGDAILLAEEESHKRGFRHSVVILLNREGESRQIGNIVNGQWQSSGGMEYKNRDPMHRSKAKRRAATTYTRSTSSKRKLTRRATPQCVKLLSAIAHAAETSTKERLAGNIPESRKIWDYLERLGAMAQKAGCGEVQISEATEDGLALGRKAK